MLVDIRFPGYTKYEAEVILSECPQIGFKSKFIELMANGVPRFNKSVRSYDILKEIAIVLEKHERVTLSLYKKNWVRNYDKPTDFITFDYENLKEEARRVKMLRSGGKMN